MDFFFIFNTDSNKNHKINYINTDWWTSANVINIIII